MAAEDFFNRWSRKNAEAREALEQAGIQDPAASPDAVEAPADPFEGRLPTLEDVQQVTPESDFAPFMKQGVDQTVQRAALKKLFADPHFNVMDGLDVYIDDYTKSDPIPSEMMAMLNHARDLLNPPETNGGTVMKMLDADPEPQADQLHREGSETTADALHEADVDAANDETGNDKVGNDEVENSQAANDEAVAAADMQTAENKGRGSDGFAASDDAGTASGQQRLIQPQSPPNVAQPATPVPPTGEETPLS